MEPVQLAAILVGAALLASMVSVRIGVSVALIELAFGIGLGNAFKLNPDPSWLVLIAGFASVVLTFLAGAEVDPDDFRERFGASVTIGVVSTGLNTVRVGKLIMSACFVTDMCTVIALSAIFLKPTVWFPVFAVVSVAVIVLLPRIAPWFFRRFGDRVIEPEIKLVFALLLGLMVLGDAANSQAVLPAFVLGLVMSRHYQQHREEQRRLRVVAFAFLTPFRFLRGGMNVSLGAVFANLGLLAVLAAAKLLPKLGLVLPLARRYAPSHAPFMTLLMSTGLTFGTISSLYGLQAHIIDRTQFSLLATVVVLSAIVPTAIAQRWFSPDVEAERAGDARIAARRTRARKSLADPIPASEGATR